MKNVLLLFAFSLLSSLSFTQSTIELNYTSDKKVYLNDTKLTKSTTIDDLKEILGEPIIYKEYPTGKINYHYKEHGITVHTVNGKLLFIGVNLNWDGDKNFPEKTFEGILKIGDITIDKNSTEEFIPQITFIEISCPIPGMCMTIDKKEKTPILIGFKDELVTQVGFEFH